MPPSRELEFRIDPAIKEKLETHLGCGDYRIIFTREQNGRIYGNHQRVGRLITINLGHSDFSASRLTDIHTHIINTLLHEYRHAYQHATWPEHKVNRDAKRDYASKEMEEDANEWASRNTTKWRSLGRLRSKGGSSLGRLAKAERSIG